MIIIIKYRHLFYFLRSMKIRKKMSGGNVDDMRIGDILCENVRYKYSFNQL